MCSSNNSFYKVLLPSIAMVAIYFQQVLVINIGGSFKIIDLICLPLFCKSIYSLLIKKRIDPTSFALFIFFLILSIPGIITTYFSHIYEEFFSYFPEAHSSLRFAPFISSLLTFLYCALNWSLFHEFASNKLIFFHRDFIIKVFVVTGFIVCIYSIYAMIFVGNLGFHDLVPEFIDYRNSRPKDYPLRTIGLSGEPGQFAVILIWLCLLSFYVKDKFRFNLGYLILYTCIFALLFTFSTILISIPIAIFLYLLIFEDYYKTFKIFIYFFSLAAILYTLLYIYELNDVVDYFLFGKFFEYLNPQNFDNITNSGVQRAFTSLLGLEIFFDYPIFGVGHGNSYFYMFKEIHKIDFYVDMLTYSTAPQNAHVMILAEVGVLGYLFFLGINLYLLYFLYKNIRKSSRDNFNSVLFIGLIANFIALFSVYPIYSSYLWIGHFFAINQVRFCFHQKYYNI
jgi:O-antigen ligase